jgi:hypothetical protein
LTPDESRRAFKELYRQNVGAVLAYSLGRVANDTSRRICDGFNSVTNWVVDVAFLATLCLPLIAAGVTVFALRNPTPGVGLVEGAHEIVSEGPLSRSH